MPTQKNLNEISQRLGRKGGLKLLTIGKINAFLTIFHYSHCDVFLLFSRWFLWQTSSPGNAHTVGVGGFDSYFISWAPISKIGNRNRCQTEANFFIPSRLFKT